MCIRDSRPTRRRDPARHEPERRPGAAVRQRHGRHARVGTCLLYTSDAADERSRVDLGGRRIIKKKKKYKKKRKRGDEHANR